MQVTGLYSGRGGGRSCLLNLLSAQPFSVPHPVAPAVFWVPGCPARHGSREELCFGSDRFSSSITLTFAYMACFFQGSGSHLGRFSQSRCKLGQTFLLPPPPSVRLTVLRQWFMLWLALLDQPYGARLGELLLLD